MVRYVRTKFWNWRLVDVNKQAMRREYDGINRPLLNDEDIN